MNSFIHRRPVITAVLISLLYFLMLFATLFDYSLMWDARTRFVRGQAYLNYFLSGQKDYAGLPMTREQVRYFRDYVHKYDPQQNVESRLSGDPAYRRSIYQDDLHSFRWYTEVKEEFGHPPFSDIGAALMNKIFYEKLGIVRDDYAYHLFPVILSSVLIGVVFYWLFSSYSLFAAVVGVLSLGSSSLYWAQSHYNIKDIPLAVFFSLTIWTFYQAIKTKKRSWFFVSALCAGASLGTKFNTVFLPFIIGPWFAVWLFTIPLQKRKAFLGWWWMFLLYPIIMFTVFYASWPQFWGNPMVNFQKVVEFYRSVGVAVDYTPTYRWIFDINAYPVVWIWYTTFPPVLFFAAVGLIGGLTIALRKKDMLPLLFIVWLFISVIRASLPSTSIFGGVRHIIEYLPAFSLLAGYGAHILQTRMKNYTAWFIIGVVALFIPYFVTLFRLHPAENAYANIFIGGLQGAKKAEIPGWGNTDGGIYNPAVVWLNEHAEQNAHIVTSFSEPADFYIPALREDLRADNRFSGFLQEGEYIITLHYDTGVQHVYTTQYPLRMLTPLLEWKADGVPLIRIWKNDPEHRKDEFQDASFETIQPDPVRENQTVTWDMGEEAVLSHITFASSENNCSPLDIGYFEVSLDGKYWTLLPESYPGEPISVLKPQPADGVLTAPFAMIPARYLSFTAQPEDACFLDPLDAAITVVKKNQNKD